MAALDFKAGDIVVLLEDLKRAEPTFGPDGLPSGHAAGDVKHALPEWEVLCVKDGSARLARGGKPPKFERSADLEALAYPPKKDTEAA